MKRKIEERYLSVSVAPPLRPIAVSLRSTGTRIDIFLSLRIKHETNIYIYQHLVDLTLKKISMLSLARDPRIIRIVKLFP